MPFVTNSEDLNEAKICWRITRRCNLSCPHCLAGDLTRYAPEVDTETCLKFVEHMEVSGVRRVVFTGGEPLLRRDLVRILTCCAEHGIVNQVTTNALGLSSRRLDQFAPLVDCFRVSVDGLRDTHNFIRRSASYDRVLTSISRSIQRGIPVVVNTVVSSRNMHELPVLVTNLYDLGVRKVVLLEYLLREHGAACSDLQVSHDELSRLEEQLETVNGKLPGLVIRLNRYSSDDDRYIVVEADGSVVLCSDRFADLVTGNLQQGYRPLVVAMSKQRLMHRETLRIV